MTFFEYIRVRIERIIPEDLPVYFWWDYINATHKKYVVYQTENLNQERKLRPNWIRFMDNAVNVYDYSTMNQKYYPSTFLPLYPEPSEADTGEEIDILFYGYMTPRRQEIVKRLGATVVKSHDMDVLKGYIKRSRFVLSVGCYDNVYASPMRVCPALNMGANILMEPTQETWLQDYLLENMKDRIKLL